MEVLAALGIAAAVVQFVDFSSKLVSKGQQLYRFTNGALAENTEMEEASRRLQVLTEPLQVPQEDDAIVAICMACVDVSGELVACLSNLKVPTGHHRKRWKSFRQALKSVWSKEKIKEIKQRLDSLRGELHTHVALNIRDKVTIVAVQQDGRFNSLDTATRNIMEALLELPTTIRKDMGNQFGHFIRSEYLEHSKTRAVLIDHTRTQLDNRVCQSIIESLHFSTRTVRHETIPEAHKRTFEWVFRDPVANGKPWSNFGHWLENGAGIYWINGKAGSGKSTLMKFIVDHEKTREMLDVWAQGTSQETPSFFFWKSGDVDQRSQEGLLRSLLYDVLRKHPELVPSVFPDIWTRKSELVSHNVPHTFSTWTLTKLKQSFARLVACKTLKICFFIDGLDEYEGDYEELAEYFGQLSCSTHVKLCLSSRPWPAFSDAFGDCAGLRLQDLTYHDIKRYINDKLNNSSKMVLLKQREPKRARYLIDGLIWKAEGAFLWVTLVVKSLLNGLRNRNSLDTLERRFNALPCDLENLYSHILSSIDPQDMEQGSKIFQLFQACDYEKDMELIYRALRGTLLEALNSPLPIATDNPREMQRNQINLIYEEMCIFLQACCGGLIELHITEATDYSWRRWELSYIHCTVSDYLATAEIWNGILSHTSHTSWDPRKALLNSSVMCLRNVIPGLEAQKQSVDYVKRHWFRFLTHATTFLDGGLSYDDIILLLDNFDRAATYVALCCCWAQINAGTNFNHWSNYIAQTALPRPNFISIAAESGLWFYVKRRLEDTPPLLLQKLEVPLLVYILLQLGPRKVYSEARLKTVEVILSFSTDPNEVFRGHSLWQYWVSILHTVAERGYRHPVKLLQRVTIELLEAGADLRAGCVEGTKAWQEVYQELWAGEEFTDRYVSCAGTTVSDLIDHSREGWKDRGNDTFQCRRARVLLFAGKENLAFEERHCLKAVIKDLFRNRDPKGTDKILQLIEKLEAEKASRQCEVLIREREPNTVEEGID